MNGKWDLEGLVADSLPADQIAFWNSIRPYGGLPFDHMPAEQLYHQYWRGAILSESPNNMHIKRRGFVETVPVKVHIPPELANSSFTFTVNKDFESALLGTAEVRVVKPGAYMPEHWLGRHGMKVLEQLNGQGLAHSIEVYDGETLAGGVIGLSNGRAFLSMDTFRFVDDPLVNRAAFLALQAVLAEGGFDWHETATPNRVTRDFGGNLLASRQAEGPRDAAIAAGKAIVTPLDGKRAVVDYAHEVSDALRPVYKADRPGTGLRPE